MVVGTNPRVCSSKSSSSSTKAKCLRFFLPMESGGRLAILRLEQDTTIQIQPHFWGNYSCDKIVTTGLLYCITCLLYCCMCCLWLGLCYLSQSGYLLDEGGNDGFSEFLFKVIVANGCSQKPLSLSRDLYSCSTEQSLLLLLPSLSNTICWP